MSKAQKSNRAARGTITCDNTTLHLLKANDFVAEGIRKRMAEQHTLLLNITSSPGSGKTTLLQETARRIGDQL
ncbi:MAG: hypothetical protein KDC44_13555, partial [Phaeodactylibacter sp.]|nr:hypothetical protein [Phaeodactylibacter sp.]